MKNTVSFLVYWDIDAVFGKTVSCSPGVILSVFAKDLAAKVVTAGCFAEFTLERSEGLNMTV
jgi:hypothetical protein